MPARILVADTPEGDRRIADILAGYELVYVRTLGAALRALADDGFALALIGVHFDDSRMFDLLRSLQGSPVPVACVRSHHFASTSISVEGLQVATRALGCALFVDLTWYADDPRGNDAVRKQLESLISP